jgi:predicted transcriptional regulator
MKKEEIEIVSQVFKALSSKERVAALGKFETGKNSLLDIAKEVGMSRTGFQNIINDFRDIKLVEQVGHRSYYKLSSKGTKVLSVVRTFGSMLSALEDQLKRAQLKISLARFGSGLSEEEIKEIFREVKEDEN